MKGQMNMSKRFSSGKVEPDFTKSFFETFAL